MTARLHALVQYADDFDQSGLDRAVVEDVHRLFDCYLRIVAAGMADVKAADSGVELAAASRQRARGIDRRLPHRRCKERGVASLGFIAPSFAARRKDVDKVGLRWTGEAEARHQISGQYRAAPVLRLEDSGRDRKSVV